MTADHEEEAILFGLRALPAVDVDGNRARQLRARCHRELRKTALAQDRRVPPGAVWSQIIGPGLVAGWCVVYLIATLRAAAVIYGF